jgi:hypothetical protein
MSKAQTYTVVWHETHVAEARVVAKSPAEALAQVRDSGWETDTLEFLDMEDPSVWLDGVKLDLVADTCNDGGGSDE